MWPTEAIRDDQALKRQLCLSWKADETTQQAKPSLDGTPLLACLANGRSLPLGHFWTLCVGVGFKRCKQWSDRFVSVENILWFIKWLFKFAPHHLFNISHASILLFLVLAHWLTLNDVYLTFNSRPVSGDPQGTLAEDCENGDPMRRKTLHPQTFRAVAFPWCIYTLKSTFPYVISFDLIKSLAVVNFNTWSHFHSTRNDGGPELTAGCRMDSRKNLGIQSSWAWFGYSTSLRLHILSYKIRSLNLMMILLALIFHDDDNKFHVEQQFRVKAGLEHKCLIPLPLLF